jgi:hypothetical protein
MERCVEAGEGGLISWLGRSSGGPEALGDMGASPDRLAKHGFRVPQGSCVTTAAFRSRLTARNAEHRAGLHETELDVPPDDAPAAVRRCWGTWYLLQARPITTGGAGR